MNLSRAQEPFLLTGTHGNTWEHMGTHACRALGGFETDPSVLGLEPDPCVCPNTQLGSLPNAAAATGTRCVWLTRCACRTGPPRLMQVPVCCVRVLRLARLAGSLLIGRLHVLCRLDWRQLCVALLATWLRARSAQLACYQGVPEQRSCYRQAHEAHAVSAGRPNPRSLLPGVRAQR